MTQTATSRPAIGQTMAQELSHESTITRKVIERIPNDLLDYKPHPKSMTMGQLASHLAEMLSWGIVTIKDKEFNIEPDYKPWQGKTTDEILKKFEQNLKEFIAALEEAPDSIMMEQWSLKKEGEVVFSLPRVATLRSMILNHLIHHRAQLGVYLRLNNIPVPATYGPSADEVM